MSVAGDYESLAPTLIEKAKFALSDVECFYSGRELKLLADSTFTLTDKTNILTGKWHQKRDLIDLHFLSNKYVSDSLFNKLGSTKIPLKDLILRFSSSSLYYFLTDSNRKCVEIFKAKS